MSIKILDRCSVKSNVTRLIVKCNKMATIEELPDEIMMEILSLMSIKEICCCAQVCQRWRILSEDESLWRKINLSDKKVPVKFVEKVLRHGCQ